MDLEKKFEDLKSGNNDTGILPFIGDIIGFDSKDKKSLFVDFVGEFYFKYIKNKQNLKEGIILFEEMRDDILTNLDTKPSLDELYSKIQNTDVIEKKVENLLKLETNE